MNTPPTDKQENVKEAANESHRLKRICAGVFVIFAGILFQLAPALLYYLVPLGKYQALEVSSYYLGLVICGIGFIVTAVQKQRLVVGVAMLMPLLLLGWSGAVLGALIMVLVPARHINKA